jgi:hypothetical protein
MSTRSLLIWKKSWSIKIFRAQNSCVEGHLDSGKQIWRDVGTIFWCLDHCQQPELYTADICFDYSGLYSFGLFRYWTLVAIFAKIRRHRPPVPPRNYSCDEVNTLCKRRSSSPTWQSPHLRRLFPGMFCSRMGRQFLNLPLIRSCYVAHKKHLLLDTHEASGIIFSDL